jgi:hypothetical protein
MDRYTFILSFLMAGVIGFLGYGLLKSWKDSEKIRKRMFSDPPRPSLKPIVGSDYKSVGPDPEQSPFEVLTQGCISMVGHWLLEIMLLVSIPFVVWFSARLVGIREESILGITFAGVIGWLLQQIRTNWIKIADRLNMILKPPIPSLVQEKEKPPNNFYAAARLALRPPPAYPPLPPFSVLAKGSVEISWRFIWLILLFALLLQSAWLFVSYLTDGTIQFFGSEAFGV